MSEINHMYQRMIGDVWLFGLIDENGVLYGITSIDKFYDDGRADVEFMTRDEVKDFRYMSPTGQIFGVGTERTKGVINLNKIVAAFELSDT